MALITPTHVYKLLDKATAGYTWLKGSGNNGAGDGTHGASLKVDDILDLSTGEDDATFIDSDLQVSLIPVARNLTTLFSVNNLYGAAMAAFISKLSTVCALNRTVSATIVDLDSFLYYYNYLNGVTYWQCLAPPEWREAYFSIRGSYPRPQNVYQVIKEPTFANAMYKKTRVASVDTNLDGEVIDYTEFAGGRCAIKWTGGAGAGACSISVVGKDQDDVVETWSASGTWGAGIFTATQAGTVLTPTRAHSLLTNVTSVTITGITDAVFYVESWEPSGRTYPAV